MIMKNYRTSSAALLLFLVAALAACSPHTSEKPAAKKGGHVHVAPHGGLLVEVGEHQFNLEFVHDEASGRLSVYTLDAHAENFTRTSMSSFEVVISAGGEVRTVTFLPVASPASGETVGDTSQYDATDPWLKDKHAFAAIVPKIDLKGTMFTDILFRFSEDDDDHDHEHENH